MTPFNRRGPKGTASSASNANAASILQPHSTADGQRRDRTPPKYLHRKASYGIRKPSNFLLALSLLAFFYGFGVYRGSILSQTALNNPHYHKQNGQLGLGASFLSRHHPHEKAEKRKKRYTPKAPEQPKLSLQEFKQVQQNTVHGEDISPLECHSLPVNRSHSNSHNNNDAGVGLMVWAYDEAPAVERLKRSIHSFPRDTKLHIFCGSTLCMRRANHIRVTDSLSAACIEVHRLVVPDMARDTPLNEWAQHNVLNKLLAAHHYEDHLQLAMQMAVLYKYGGVMLQPGVLMEDLMVEDDTNLEKASMHVGTCHHTVARQRQDRTTIPNSNTLLSGGFWGLRVTKGPRDEALESLMMEFLKMYSSTTQPIVDRYHADRWPLQWDPQDLVHQDDPRMDIYALKQESCPKSDHLFADGAGGPAAYYATLNYDERHKYLLSKGNPGMNLGDETQGLAGLQVLPRLDAFVERDRLDMVKFTNSDTRPLPFSFESSGNATHLEDDGRRVHVFMNAWWGTPTMVWPPPSFVEPITISMHFQPKVQELILERSSGEDEQPNFLQRVVHSRPFATVSEDTSIPVENAPYLREQEPIGARDTKTLAFLRSNGVNAVFSACLTMTLSLPQTQKDGSILIVDVKDEKLLADIVPSHVLDKAKHLTQKLLGDDAEDGVRRFVLAFERLLAYSKASLVITNRLHVALPSVALGATVIFIHGKSLPGGGGNRMDGLDGFMYAVRSTSDLPQEFDWDNPPGNPKTDEFRKQVKRIRQLSTCHSGLVDSAQKFGAISLDWIAGEEMTVCTRESAWTSIPDAIHIATTLDSLFLHEVLPSWLNALAKSNEGEKLVLYFLTVNLSEKQRCLLRLMVIKVLPDAVVFTIPASVADFEESYTYRRRGHISVATQARLRLPSLVPCVEKVLWLDLDAFVIGRLRPIWNMNTGKCGIAGRDSVAQYMDTQVAGKLKGWHEKYGRSFNAGVLLLDLESLRASQFEDKIVEYWAKEWGANDQATFNLACNSTHEHLDAAMNVFQGKSQDLTPPRDQWIIAHFQSSNKPWSSKWNPEGSSPGFTQIWEENKLSMEEVLDL